MELLPNSVEDFTSKDYWTRFFRNYKGDNGRGFEWYGDFESLRNLLLGSLGESGGSELDRKRILHVGCGNSTLATKLYDEGFRNITNIDFSREVIEVMRERNKKRKELEWICMDIEKDFGEYVEKDENKGKFDAIIDKGFLDAFLSDSITDTPSSKAKLVNFLTSSLELLATNGRYILITLGQDYVAKALTIGLYNYGLEIIVEPLVKIQNSKFLPYYIEIIKSTQKLDSGNSFFKIKGMEFGEDFGSINHSIWTLSRKLKELSAMYWNNKYVGDYSPGEIKEYRLNAKNSKNGFFITVYDRIVSDNCEKLTVGFLVPLGEEQDWLYSTRRGFEEISDQAKCKRLIVISRLYANTEEVSKVTGEDVIREISDYLSPLALRGSGKFPILTVGSERVLEKELIFSYSSKFCREVLIFNVKESGVEKRQMVFKSSPRLIQSEVVMHRNEKNQMEFDYHHCLSNYYIGVILVSSLVITQKKQGKKNCLILGLGGGVLASILSKLYPRSILDIVAVEIDPNVKEAAINFFGFPEEDVEVVVCDASEYLESVYLKNKGFFDYIIVDINSSNVNDSLMCPGIEFLSREFIKKLLFILSNNGCIVYNVSCRSSERREELFIELGNQISDLETEFGRSRGLELQLVEIGEEEINELWVIKGQTENNLIKIRDFIVEKRFLIGSEDEEISRRYNSEGEIWIKRLSELR
ncbi:spermine/spermidine synthase family,related protein [Cryptosporidium felis]|nr:spermine/spermidine synthase family,related protein [Cryptosporidium felis]